MEVIIKADAGEVSFEAARIFCRQLERKPASVLGLATGSTPLGLYRELSRMHEQGGIDFSRATTFNLDEYVGLAADHPQSYAAFMREHLFSKVNIPNSAINIPDGLARDVPRHCEDYEERIAASGGIDLQLLGLGANGHIGFNEPTSSLNSGTRIKTLAAQTIADNARFFASSEEVPHHVITMGVGTIMQARHVVVLAVGGQKARAVAASVEGPITASMPASILQMHRKCTLVIDEAAASQLERLDYFRWVYENKPDWQRV